MISQTAEYALRAMVDLAYHFGTARKTREIAAGTKVPRGYLAKILQDLARAGLVLSQRGLHGGFALARAPDRLTVYDVLQAVDPVRRIRSCPLHIAAHANRLCPLHQKLDDAMAQIEAAFTACTIADITADPVVQPLRARVQPLTISGGLAPLSVSKKPRTRIRAR